MNSREFKQALAIALAGNSGFNPEPTEDHLVQVAITHSLNRNFIESAIKVKAIAMAEIFEAVVDSISDKIDK